MRVLFCTTGGAGHLLPLRPLAEALRAQGHDIAWATAPDALPRLEGLGFRLFAAGPTFEASRRQFREVYPEATRLRGASLSAFTFPRLFGAILAPAMLGDLEQALRRWTPDLVVHEPAALAVPLACRQHGLRHVVHGYGLRPPSDYLAAAMTWLEPLWRARGLEAPADGGLDRYLTLDITPARLQPSTGMSNERVFRFNPYRPVQVAPPALPAELQAALQGPAARRPRIYLTFGTVFNRSPALIAAVQAAAQLGGTLVVTVGVDGDLRCLTGLPGQVHVLPFVDQRALLPRCDVVVSHGGAGTVLGAAAQGLPQLVLPQAADHFRNARALCAAGAGLTIAPEDQTVEFVASTLRGLLASASTAAGATRLAREMAALPDAAATARHLERWQSCAEAGAPTAR